MKYELEINILYYNKIKYFWQVKFIKKTKKGLKQTLPIDSNGLF